MTELITTALAVSGLFAICYPVAMVLLNVVLSRMESEAAQSNFKYFLPSKKKSIANYALFFMFKRDPHIEYIKDDRF